jgi:hypothetical protein
MEAWLPVLRLPEYCGALPSERLAYTVVLVLTHREA